MANIVFSTVLERRQVGWGPDVALAGVWAVLADFYLSTPLHFSISNYNFLLEFSTNDYLQISDWHSYLL